MEEVLAPAHLLAGDIEAGQRGDQRHGEHERPRPDERQEQQAGGDEQAEQRNEEMRDLEQPVTFRQHVTQVEMRRELVGPDRERRHQQRNA